MRGRKSEPAEVKEAKGNPGRRPTGVVSTEDLPTLAGDAPVELTEAGRKIWLRLVPPLRQMNLIRVTDEAAVARYCNHMARFWELTQALEDEGGEYYETDSAHGRMLRVHPAFRVRQAIEMRLEALEDRIGLSPRSRQEIMYRLSQSAVAASSPRPAEAQAPAGPSESPLGLLGRAAQVH